MNRRILLVSIAGLILGSVASGVLGALGVDARPAGGIPRVGVLGVTPTDPSLAEAFARGLRESGYVDRRDVVIEP